MATAPEKIHIESTVDTCGGKPRITGTRIRVQDIVVWIEAGRYPDEIVGSYAQLTLADAARALSSRWLGAALVASAVASQAFSHQNGDNSWLFTAAEKTLARSILAEYAAVSGLVFVETADTDTTRIRFFKDGGPFMLLNLGFLAFSFALAVFALFFGAS